MPRGNLSVPSERKPAVTDNRYKSLSRIEFELDKGDHFLRIEFAVKGVGNELLTRKGLFPHIDIFRKPLR
jgi:hypothetical protein